MTGRGQPACENKLLSAELRNFFTLIAFFLIFFEHFVLAVPFTWMRGRKLIYTLLFIFSTVIIVFSPKSPVWKPYLAAKRFYAEGKYDLAARADMDALEFNPQFYRAFMWLAYAYMPKGEYVKARECLLRAVHLIVNDDQNLKFTCYNLGWVYLQESDSENSWKYYRKAYESKADVGDVSRWWTDFKPSYYVSQNDKNKFYTAMSSLGMPEALTRRIDYLKEILAEGWREKVFRESLQYLEENRGTIYRPHFLSLMKEALSKMRPDLYDYASFHEAYQKQAGEK